MHVVSGASAVAAFVANVVASARTPTAVQALRAFARVTATTHWRKNGADSFGLGRFVELQQRDPALGPGARLDIVEYASVEGGPAAYDVRRYR